MNEQEELIKYCVKLRAKGDSFREIEDYLFTKSDDKEMILSIMDAVEDADKKGLIAQEKGMKAGPDYVGKGMGLLFLVGGIGLTVMLWDMGWVGFLPILLIIVGIASLLGFKVSSNDLF